MSARVIRIGTRASQLARWQADLVQRLFESANAGRAAEQVLITTTGDRKTDAPLPSFGGVGVFTREIETALLGDSIDIAVHSLKDLPSARSDGTRIVAVLPREDPRDALVAAAATCWQDLPDGATVGTSSVRRGAQLLHLRSDLRLVPIRGNVPTRLQRLDEGLADAIMLASAGLTRLGLADRITQALSTAEMMPAPGQGAIAVEARADDADVAELLAPLNDDETASRVAAERALMAEFGGGCHLPLGALASISGGEMTVEAITAAPDGSELIERNVVGPPGRADELGRELARDLIAAGGHDLMGVAGDADQSASDV